MADTNPTKIMVFGTFDLLHKGHLHFFKQARKLAKKPCLIVSVARDKNVRKIKGKKPQLSEKRRLALVKNSKFVDKAVLGALGDYVGHIIKQNPAIIALGYDQKAYTKGLKAILKKSGLIVKIKRLKAYKPLVYKSSFFKKNKLYGKGRGSGSAR
jgi:FAD synthetase